MIKRRTLVRAMMTFLALLIPIMGYAAGLGEAKIYGKTYGQWSAAWWQWGHTLPATIVPHPIRDEGDVDCSLGQTPPVYFLAGLVLENPPEEPTILSGERTCTIPRGVALFFPIVNAELVNEPGDQFCFDDPEDPTTARPCTVDEKRAILDFILVGARNICGATVSIDGAPVVTLVTARTQSPTYTVAAGPDDPFGIDEGIVDEIVVSDGFWMMVPPLSTGPHELSFRGSFCLPLDPEDPFSPLEPFLGLEMKYNLTVAPGG